jgi:hypothetical protein
MYPSAEVIERWQGQTAVPLAEVAHAVGLDYHHTKYALRKGLVEPIPDQRGFGNAHMIDWDQVVLFLAAAVLAAMAGIAVVTALRSLRNSGAQVGPNGVTIPVTLPNIST